MSESTEGLRMVADSPMHVEKAGLMRSGVLGNLPCWCICRAKLLVSTTMTNTCRKPAFQSPKAQRTHGQSCLFDTKPTSAEVAAPSPASSTVRLCSRSPSPPSGPSSSSSNLRLLLGSAAATATVSITGTASFTTSPPAAEGT